MSPRLLALLLILAAVILEVGADVLFKRWALGSKGWLLAVGLALYFSGTVLWAISLKHEDLARAGVLFGVLSIMLVVLAGAIFFGERMTLMQKAGTALGLASIVLMEM